MKEKKKSSGSLIRIILIWMCIILLVASYFVISIAGKATTEHLSEDYHNKILITYEYTRRVISDVYVSVTSNAFFIERNLDKPEGHKEVMKRIVENGTRVHSCGISFIEDYYYPKKGHRFCPFAWRNPKNREEILMEEKGDESLDYLKDKWFLSVIETDTAKWSEPFYDGYDNTTTLTAYMVPIHDTAGRPVAVLGADISLDWFAEKMIETDSTINAKTKFANDFLGLRSHSYIINHDGTFITHPDANRIMKDSFFRHIKPYKDSMLEKLIEKIRTGRMSDKESEEKYLYDGQKSYLFFTPVKYTEWIIVTVVPSETIDLWGIVNSLVLLALMAFSMLAIIVLYHFYARRYLQPKQNECRKE